MNLLLAQWLLLLQSKKPLSPFSLALASGVAKKCPAWSPDPHFSSPNTYCTLLSDKTSYKIIFVLLVPCLGLFTICHMKQELLPLPLRAAGKSVQVCSRWLLVAMNSLLCSLTSVCTHHRTQFKCHPRTRSHSVHRVLM